MQAVRSMAVGDPAYAKMASNPAMQLALVPPRPTESVVTRTKDLRQTKTSYEGGVAGEEWNDGIVDLNLRPGTGAVTADLVGNDPSYKDFHEFSWINSSNFQARKKNGDHDYLVFQQKMPALAVLDLRLFNNLKSSDPSSEQVTSMVLVTATVDATSKLPVSLQIGDEVHTYTFLQPNDVMLVMPPKFAAVERQTLAIYQAMHKQRPMP